MVIEKKVYKKKRKITGLEISELSLVDFPSNQKSFYLTKRDKTKDVQDPELEGLLRDWLDEDLVKMSGEELALKLKDSLKLLSKLKSELPDPVTAAMKTYFAFIAQGAGDYGNTVDDQDQADDEDVQDDEAKAKAKLKKNSDRFPSMNVTSILAGSSKFQKRLRKAAAAADKNDDQDEDDELVDADPGDEVTILKKEIAMKDRVIEKLRRGHSSQAKTGVDDDEHFAVEKDSGIDPKTGKPTRDLFPSWSLF